VSDPFRHDDAAYVLGALSDDERREFEAHLETCPDCAARVAEVAPLPRLLAGLPEDAFRPRDEPVPDTLLPALLRAVRREQRRRRGILAALGGLAAACLVALAVVVAWPSQPSRAPQAASRAGQAMTAVVASPVSATALITDVGWGTRIELTCRYGDGYEQARDYALVVVDKHAVVHDAGTWQLAAGKAITFTGGTSLHRAEIARVEITPASRTDQPVLQLRL
jgi:hypothetical protein